MDDFKQACINAGGAFNEETNMCILSDNDAFERIGNKIWKGEITGKGNPVRVRLKKKDVIKEIGADDENVWKLSYLKKG